MTSLSADDSFLSHYDFSHDPFAARVPGFKFFPAQRKPVLGQLHHLARYSQLLLVVTGPEGSGKTLVRQALVASSNKQSVQSVVISPQETIDSNALLQQVSQGLGSPGADFESIMAQIIQLALTGQEVYLLVDDAERLTGAAVETLLRLAQGNPEGRPHVFLFGELSLVARLEALVEGEERFHVIALQPYEEDETREYLALRLEGAGSSLSSLSEEQITRIHESSGGWPGAINQAARDELIDAMQHSKGARKSAGWGLPLPGKHLLALVAVLCVVVIAMLMRDAGEQPATPATTELPLGTGAPGSLPEGSTAGQPGMPAGDSAPVLSQPQPEQPLVREPLAAAGSAEVDELPEQPELEETPVPVTEQSREADLAGTDTTGAVVEEESPPQNASPTSPPSEPKPARQNVAKPDVSASEWYASQPGTSFLVQVLGTRTRSNADAFLKQHGDSYRYFTKLHDGKPLYVVTYGSFSSRNAALEAIKTMPSSLKSGKPWVRSFANVKAEIVKP